MKKKSETPHKARRISKHHRKPKSKGGTDNLENISFVTPKEHNAYNLLFGGNASPEKVAEILNEIWIDPDFILIVRRVK